MLPAMFSAPMSPEDLGEILVREIEEYLAERSRPMVRPERARVARLRLADEQTAVAVAAELAAGGSFYAAAQRLHAEGRALPGDMFATVHRSERPDLFRAQPGTTFPPEPDLTSGYVILRLIAFEH